MVIDISIMKMKKISKDAIMEFANQITKITGYGFWLYYAEKAKAKKKQGHVGLRILAPGNDLSTATDYGELKHRDACVIMIDYAKHIGVRTMLDITDEWNKSHE